MTTLLSLFVASLRRLSSRLRARLARKLAALSRGAARLLASGVSGGLAQRLCQVAVACGLAAVVAGGIGTVAHAGGGGSTFRVSDRSAFIEKRPSVARDADGDYVVVWQSWYRDGPGYGVYARRYNSADQPKGPSFRINSSTSNWERNPAVAMDRDGDFVVVWQDYDADSYGIMARVFDKDGAPKAGEFMVNTYQTGYQVQPDVAMDADGNFVVTWSSYYQASSASYTLWDVYARRFTADGTPAGGEFLVNETIAYDQFMPAVAADDAGNFVIVWSHFNSGGGTGHDIMMRRFAADGTSIAGEQRVNFYTSGGQVWPDVAMDQDGDFVVVWQGAGYTYNYSFSSYYDYDADGVFGRRFNANGTPQNGDFRVNQSGANGQFDAKVAMDADGNFVVAFVDDNGGGSWGYNVIARRFHAASPLNNPVSADGGNFMVFASYYATACDVAMDADGDFVIVGNQYYGSYFSHDQGTSFSYFQIRAYSDRFEGNGTSAAPTVAGVFLRDDHHHVSAGESLARHFQSLVVSFSRAMEAVDVENTGNWGLTRNGSNVPVQSVLYYYNPMLWRYEALVYFGPQPLGDGNFVLTLNGGIEGENGEVMGANFSLDFRVRTPKARGGNVDVAVDGTSTVGLWGPAVARDADGDFVVAWHEYSGGDYQVYARRYNAAGAPQGPAFLVAQNSYGFDRNPAVAMDPDGNFVVVWDGYGYDSNMFSYDSQGIWARVFNADGTQRTGDILVNTTGTGSQQNPSVSMDYDGNFVVAWDGMGWGSYDNQGIFFRRFDRDGNPKGDHRRANIYGTGNQYNPSVAMDKDGDFVIAWSSFYNSYGYIMLQKFDNDGRRILGGDVLPGYEGNSGFRDQRNPSVAIDDDGDFVVVWNEYAYDYYYGLGYTAAYMIRGRRFGANLVPQGPTFEIHTADFDPAYTNYNKPSVSMDADGDFVVAFTAYMLISSSPYASSSYYRGDAFVRRYNARGVAQGPAVQVNTGADRWAWEPVVAMDADGDFVVVFSRTDGVYTPAALDEGITFQLYQGNNAPTTSGIPDQTMDEDDLPRIINLTAFFSDVEDGAGGLVYSVVGNTNAALVVPGISGNNLGLALIPDAFGTADITIRATDKDGLWVEDVFTLTVNSMPETGPTIITKTKKKGGCVAEDAGAAPWGLLAVFAMLLGSLSGLVRRRQS